MSVKEQETILVTGVAGFIGYHTAVALLGQGKKIIGIDNLNEYYPRSLKEARLAELKKHDGFVFFESDIADHESLLGARWVSEIDCIIHLAAQAGVRYSLENPFAYASSNLTGHLAILELARQAPRKPRFIYASSSSVYGANTKTPFSETDPVERPVSLYAATKRSDELLSESYATLYGLNLIGLRFFTVYGPWGRPDMAYWSFCENILDGKPIHVFNNGKLARDFTYIDDIIAGIISIATASAPESAGASHKIYNIGGNRPVELLRFIEIIEETLGMEAEKVYVPMQPGDVVSTCADISAISRDYGYAPATSLEVGIPRFVKWFLDYRSGKAPQG
ncbi:MAG: NAD-dependent epimerase [Hyphococcus sp.]|nr:MAG: NAD-dependent epimerase [Marinicaulis sp.]